jgi:hypothetical protein
MDIHTAKPLVPKSSLVEVEIAIEKLRSYESPGPDQIHSLYSSPNVVRVIKSRRMRWAGHVARMGKGRVVYRVLVGVAK